MTDCELKPLTGLIGLGSNIEWEGKRRPKSEPTRSQHLTKKVEEHGQVSDIERVGAERQEGKKIC